MSTQVNIKESGVGWKLIVVLLLILSGLGFYCHGLLQKNLEQKETISKMANNVDALSGRVDYYKVKLSDTTMAYAAKVNQLTIKVSDYKRLYAKETQTVKRMGIKLSEVSNIGQISIGSKDTVFVPSYISQGIIKADYKSRWIDISVSINNEKAKFSYEKTDSILFVKTVHRKSLFWGLIKYGQKSYTFDVISFDPNSHITGISYKEIIK